MFFRIPIAEESFAGGGIENWLNSVAEPTNKKILTATLEFLNKVEKTDYRTGKTSIEISELDIESQPITFPMPSNTPFYETFKEKIQWLAEAGICPYRLAAKTLSQAGENSMMYDEEIPALVLSMDDLGIGFEFCLFPLLLSLLAFILEIIHSRIKELLTVLIVMNAYFKRFKRIH